MLGALLANLEVPVGHFAPTDGRYWRRRYARKAAPIAVVEAVVEENPELGPAWDQVRFDLDLEARVNAAMLTAQIEFNNAQWQSAEVARLLKIIADEIEDEESIILLQ